MVRFLMIGVFAALAAIGVAQHLSALGDSGPPHAVAAVAQPVGDASPAPDGEASIAKSGDGHFWADGQVDGHPVHFLIDTGATWYMVDPALADQIVRVLMAETGSLGVRGQTLTRWLARRHHEEVEVDGFPVRVKVSPGRVKAEYDDVARVARRVGRPIREITWRAESAARRREERSGHPSAHQPEGEGPDDRAG